MKGRVLIIAGSDSGGGAGIEADVKTVTALGGYAATAITALTVQDTRRVHAIHGTPPEFVAAQIRAVLDDIGADAIKTGMLWSEEIVEAVSRELNNGMGAAALIVDPVMAAKGGQHLLDIGAAGGVKAELFRLATIVTPNIPEAEALTGLKIANVEDMTHAAEMMLSLGPKAVLVKGGHLDRDDIVDVLVSEEGAHLFESRRIDSLHTHGTGCTLASAIAAGVAQGRDLTDAVMRARAYVQAAIRTAPGYGQGHGPMNHGHVLDALRD